MSRNNLVTQEDFLEGCSSGKYSEPRTFGIRFANGIFVTAKTETGRYACATIKEDREKDLKRVLGGRK